MTVKFKVIANALFIYLIGELDEFSALNTRELIDKIISDYPSVNSVVFNLSGMTFMDSTGIGMLIGRYKKLKAKKITAYVESPSVSAQKILEISGLYKIMPKI